MSILFTFNNIVVISTPASPAPSSFDFTLTGFSAASNNPFSGTQQINDWGASLVSWSVQLPPMKKTQADDWAAFFGQCRGMTNGFLMGDPLGAIPKGSVQTTGAAPLVNGVNQVGYLLNTKGWVPNAAGVLKRGDYLQVGYRLHRIEDDVNADSSGNATLPIYPNIRETPADGEALITRNTVGLFRMASNSNKFSINEGEIYGFQFTIREAF